MKLFSRLVYRIFKRKSNRYYKEQDRLFFASKSSIEKYQLKKLQKILPYVYNNNSFYRNLWDQNNVNVNIKSLKDLESFPLVTKEILRKGYKDKLLISIPYINKKNHVDKTTGSSGEPFLVTKDAECYDRHYANFRYAMKSYGLNFGDRHARLWRGKLKSGFLDKIKSKIIGKINICIYDPEHPNESALNGDRIIEIIKTIEKNKPLFLDGFVSALSIISNYMVENSIKLSYTPKFIVTGAEPLFDRDRDMIERAFNCKVVNRYGGTEFGLLGQECSSQSNSNHYLHVQSYKTYVEIIKTSKSLSEGEIVVTDLFNKAMPLIRYKSGDYGDINTDYQCACGSNTPVFTSISGRENDILKLKDGAYISSHLWHNIMKNYTWIKKYQITEKNTNNFKILFEIDRNLYSENEYKTLQKKINKILLNPKEIIWELDSKIKPGIGGKYRQCISLLKDSR
jgi:phenylacetate-CoA ligase